MLTTLSVVSVHTVRPSLTHSPCMTSTAEWTTSALPARFALRHSLSESTVTDIFTATLGLDHSPVNTVAVTLRGKMLSRNIGRRPIINRLPQLVLPLYKYSLL